MTLAMHLTTLLAFRVTSDSRWPEVTGWRTTCVRRRTDRERPADRRASWVGPITERGVAIVGARQGSHVTACAAPSTVRAFTSPVKATALQGFVWAYVMFAGTPCLAAGETTAVMARAYAHRVGCPWDQQPRALRIARRRPSV
jgi:hypothetical protein